MYEIINYFDNKYIEVTVELLTFIKYDSWMSLIELLRLTTNRFSCKLASDTEFRSNIKYLLDKSSS